MQSVKSFNIMKKHFIKEVSIGMGVAVVTGMLWYENLGINSGQESAWLLLLVSRGLLQPHTAHIVITTMIYCLQEHVPQIGQRPHVQGEPSVGATEGKDAC